MRHQFFAFWNILNSDGLLTCVELLQCFKPTKRSIK